MINEVRDVDDSLPTQDFIQEYLKYDEQGLIVPNGTEIKYLNACKGSVFWYKKTFVEKNTEKYNLP